MNHILRISVIAAIVGASLPAYGALGEVSVSGSVWTGKVDGVTRYTGSSMAAAEVACRDAMSSGTIRILSSGNTNGQMSTKTNVLVDGTGKTFTGSGTSGVLYAANASNVGGQNLVYNHNNWFGHLWRTCNGQNMNGSRGTANLTFRIDNCSGGSGYGLYAGSPTDAGAAGSRGSHNLETYGLSGTNTAGTITSNDRADGCGVLLNFSSNFTGSANSTRCDWGGAFGGLRTANNNGRTTVGLLTATSCGRGYYSAPGSRDCTINQIQVYTTSSAGIWLQSTYNTRVSSGTVRSANPCSTISGGSGNSITVTCQ